MKLGPNSKPHRNEPGYIAEMRCKTGGHLIVYDLTIREPQGPKDAKRWRVQHEPSTQAVDVDTLKRARASMQALAKARTADEAGIYWYIIPAFREAPAAKPSARVTGINAEETADLDRFMSDPENEQTPEGKAALKRAFGVKP